MERSSLKGLALGAVREQLLGDFHVALAELTGHHILTEIVTELVGRSSLIAMLYQSTHDAVQSCQDHVAIVEALARGDTAEAERLMEEHIGQVQAALRLAPVDDPLADLRQALAPVKPPAPVSPSPTPSAETYLGALL